MTAKDEFGHVRGTTTVFDEEGACFRQGDQRARARNCAVDYDRRFGVLRKETDPNKLVTEWQYDSLGRETLEMRPDGSQTTTTYARESGRSTAVVATNHHHGRRR
ncbi:MAG: hypothetical protein IPM54_10185 [Polyangiaceae bacterium]|nr:hypothetical protein [Polyangiaceae bacterium]